MATQQSDDWRGWHGHVRKRPDGARMRCGAEQTCSVCQAERRMVNAKKAEATEGDIPIGTEDMKTGNGVNNYVPPSLTVQGALQRLTATEKERKNGN